MGALHNTLYRLSGGKVGGRTRKASRSLLLTVAGRKTGKERTMPLLYGRDGDSYVVIASKGGDPKHPAWYLNLRAARPRSRSAGSTSRPCARRRGRGARAALGDDGRASTRPTPSTRRRRPGRSRSC